jgi:hypothetical protein
MRAIIRTNYRNDNNHVLQDRLEAILKRYDFRTAADTTFENKDIKPEVLAEVMCEYWQTVRDKKKDASIVKSARLLGVLIYIDEAR